MMNRIAGLWVSMGLFCLLSGLRVARADDATTQPSAPAVMQKVSQDVLTVLRNKSLSPQQKRDKVRDIAYANINFEIMGKLSLGQPWRDMNDDQKSKYGQEFRDLVTNTYIHLIDNYTDQDVKITGDRQEQDGDWTVQTKITGTQNGQPNQELAKVDYRLRNRQGQWKVIDFTIENASLVSNYRAVQGDRLQRRDRPSDSSATR